MSYRAPKVGDSYRGALGLVRVERVIEHEAQGALARVYVRDERGAEYTDTSCTFVREHELIATPVTPVAEVVDAELVDAIGERVSGPTPEELLEFEKAEVAADVFVEMLARMHRDGAISSTGVLTAACHALMRLGRVFMLPDASVVKVLRQSYEAQEKNAAGGRS